MSNILSNIPRDQLHRLATLALVAAIEAPKRRNKYAFQAGVAWATIEEIRKVASDAGIDVLALKERAREIAVENKEAAHAVRS